MLKFQPKAGSVVCCNYLGFIKPEMVKERPVIIIAKHKHNSKLVFIVPLSTTAPDPSYEYHLQLEEEFCSLYFNGVRPWVKCDMVNIVSLARLNLLKRKGYIPNIGEGFLNKIKQGVKSCLNII